MAVLEFRDLSVRFGTGRAAVTAVDGVSLIVPAGGVVGLVGESGSGKSTLAAVAVGLHRPSAGRVLLDGVDVTAARGRAARRNRRRVQLVFQDPYSSLDPRMTIGASIAEGFGARGARPGRAERDRRVHELLERVHIDPDRAADLPSALSGGQRQRVALARALAAEPDVIIADEITSALDVSVQGAVLNLIRELRVDLGISLLFISHNLAVVRYVSDEVAVLRRGVLVEKGPVDQVLERPEQDYTRELLAAVPRLGQPLDLDPTAAPSREPARLDSAS